jgi:DNA-directed RNA polymerase specialized sigma24 family protein
MYQDIIDELVKVKYIRDTCNIAGPLADDLFQHIWVRILEFPRDKIESINKKGYLQFYICRMIINEARNKNNPFLKTIKFKTDPIKEIEIEEYDLESDIDFETKTTHIKEKLNEIFWYDKKIFELYLEFGSLRKVAAQTGIKYGAIYQTVNKVKRIIKNENPSNRPTQ